MATSISRKLGWAAGIVAFVVLGLVLWRLRESDPQGALLHRADALGLPADFVLVHQAYEFTSFRGEAHLVRTFHASWPGLCDSLRGGRDRAGVPVEWVGHPSPFDGQRCTYACRYRPIAKEAILGRRYGLDIVALDPSLSRTPTSPASPFYWMFRPTNYVGVVSIPPG